MVNIDVQAVGDWAERRGIPYSGYTDLAAKPQVVQLIRECVEKVNADLARDPNLAASQIHRFVILHKELDADDGELTRTRKVRRGFIGEKYATIVEALYLRARPRCVVEAQGAFRGRTHRQHPRGASGQCGEDVHALKRRPGVGGMNLRDAAARRSPRRKVGDVILAVDNVSLAFGGVEGAFAK